MGSPNEDANVIRRSIVAALSKAKNEEDALQLLNWFRRYLQLSGLVYRHDQTLGKQSYGVEVQTAMRAELMRLDLTDQRALMVKTRMRLGDKVLSILLERDSANWLVIDRGEEPGHPIDVRSVQRFASSVLLRRCALEGDYVGFVAKLFFSFHQELEESSLRKMEQARRDLMEAAQIETWGDVLK